MSVDLANSSILPIGGFFGLAIDDIPPVDDSVWSEWTRHYRESFEVWNGTSRHDRSDCGSRSQTRLVARLLLRRSGNGDHRRRRRDWASKSTPLGSIVTLSPTSRLCATASEQAISSLWSIILAGRQAKNFVTLPVIEPTSYGSRTALKRCGRQMRPGARGVSLVLENCWARRMAVSFWEAETISHPGDNLCAPD